MAGGASGAGSGAVLGAALVFLAQQFGYLDFSSGILNPIVLLVIVMVVFAVLGGIVGMVLKGHAVKVAEAGAPSTSAPPPTSPPSPPIN
jgi:hypothetical protein